MFMRILTAGLILLLAFGCAKRGAKNTGRDDSATAKPSATGNANGKGDEPNFLNDPRFKKDKAPEGTIGESPNKQPWVTSAPEGGWQPPNAGAQPPLGPVGTPPLAAGGKPPLPGGNPPLGPVGTPPLAPAAGTPSTPAGKRPEEADMKEIWVYIENASGASGKMPTQVMIYQALVAAGSKAAPLVKDGTISLTGAMVRESVWAYETAALTGGGLVATQNGVETLTAAELKARLGK